MLCKDGMYDDSKQWEDYVLPGAFVCFVTVLQYNSEWENEWRKIVWLHLIISVMKTFQFDIINTIGMNKTIYPSGYLNHLKLIC